MLHIGAMKTGTTFLQQLLADHRTALAEHGFRVPRDQALALRGVLDGTPGPDATTRRDRVAGRFLREVQEYDGRGSVVSWEFLSFLDPSQARRLLDALAGVEVDVVLTVRDAARTMPAQWQTTCRNGTTLPWPRFARGIGAWLDEGRDNRAARLFRRTQGVSQMLDVWTGAVGRDRVRVVTVPRSGADPLLLWRRFAEATGIDSDLAVDPDVRRNPSLGHPSCELLRLINVVLAGTAPAGSEQVIRAVVAPDLETRAGSEPPVRLDRRGREVAAAWNGLVRDAVTSAGVAVIGDLDDLPVAPPPDAEDAHRPSPAELLAAAETARAGLLGLGATPAASTPTDFDGAVDELAAMIREVAGVDLTEARRARGRGRR
ncbi:hypothetical protein D0Z08_02315 [Nocardioides immobilis]|uniref:Sulfotransferase family protein n=1 Tax=Nocardioides immobilis TaxID=2049295 RepID=A0A417Y8C4_9ACTN|nr:hypothetical protein D0Z08_02315 [Nocardioides immobilis]